MTEAERLQALEALVLEYQRATKAWRRNKKPWLNAAINARLNDAEDALLAFELE